MNLAERIDIMVKLGKYLIADSPQLKSIKQKAYEKNKWFTQQFADLALKNISEQFLDRAKLEKWIKIYHLDDNISPKKIGIVMAGNIPLVGFHDFLSVFISGHKQKIKLSEKDDILFPYTSHQAHSNLQGIRRRIEAPHENPGTQYICLGLYNKYPLR